MRYPTYSHRRTYPSNMKRLEDPIDRRTHRKMGADLFNYTWSLLDRKHRTQAEDAELIHSAHASRYHWGHAGTALNLSIGEWQISRVYAVLGRPEPAFFHGRSALRLATRNHLGRFYVAYAYEALARAASVAGDAAGRRRYLRDAERVGRTIRDPDDRRMLFEDLRTIPGFAGVARSPAGPRRRRRRARTASR